jgi:stalled ribosome rescue protein Dom34
MKTSNINTEERAGVWMDHHIAHVVYRNDDGNYAITTIEPDEAKHHSPSKKKTTASEHNRNAKQQQELKGFFKTLQTEIKGFDHILLCGPTTAKSEFHHHLKTARGFSGKRISEMSADTMTDRQLLAFMKKNLGKPMDIFREEEVM